MDANQAQRRQEMLAKVRKLLSMARDGRGNENEEEIAMRQANKLMAAYGIAEAEVDMAAIDAGELVYGQVQCDAKGYAPTDGVVSRSIPIYAGVLAVGVARFCDAIIVERTTAHGTMLVFQGEKEDVLLARWIFGVLIDSILREQSKSGWTKRGDANAFRMAAASKLQARLKALAHERKQMYAQAQAESGSRALMVVDRKSLAIAEKFGKQKTRKVGGSRGDHGAYLAGQEAGSRINIPSGRPLNGSTHARITS